MKDKIAQIIKTVIEPLALGTTFLFFVLVLLEYFRRGFVSDFLDMRYVAALVVLFWAIGAASADVSKKNRVQNVLIVAILLFAAYVIIVSSLPFGRLGLVVISSGILIFIGLLISIIKNET